MGTHPSVISESYPMNTNMKGLGGFQKSLRPCALEEGSLSIGRVKLAILDISFSGLENIFSRIYKSFNFEKYASPHHPFILFISSVILYPAFCLRVFVSFALVALWKSV